MHQSAIRGHITHLSVTAKIRQSICQKRHLNIRSIFDRSYLVGVNLTLISHSIEHNFVLELFTAQYFKGFLWLLLVILFVWNEFYKVIFKKVTVIFNLKKQKTLPYKSELNDAIMFFSTWLSGNIYIIIDKDCREPNQKNN